MKKSLFALMALLLWGATTFASVPPRTGWWKFDDPLDMLAATTGQALVLTGTQTSVAGPVDGNLATELSVGSYLTMTHGIAANGGGTKVNEYTLQLDILMPTGGMYHAIYQTAADNSNDAEMFINPDNFIGAWRFGYSANSVSENSWYRLIVTVKNGQFFKIYMNGELWVDGAGMDVDDRDALEATLLLFADEDGEDNTMLCSEAGIWDVALTAEEVLELGDASTSTGIHAQNALKAGLLEQNSPNPASGITSFPYTLRENGDVRFVLTDLTGKVISEEKTGYLSAGTYTHKLNVDQLPAGVYYMNLLVNQSVSVKKLMVTK